MLDSEIVNDIVLPLDPEEVDSQDPKVHDG